MTVYGGDHPFAASGHVDPAAGGLPRRHVRDPRAAARHAAAPTPSSAYPAPAPTSARYDTPGPGDAPAASPPDGAPAGPHEEPAPSAPADPVTAARQVRLAAARSRWDTYSWDESWLGLAEDLFWVMHRDRDGKLLVHPRVAGLGLAAALLVGMLRTDAIEVRDGRVIVGERHELVVAGGEWTYGGIALRFVTQVLREPRPHPVRTWVEFVAGSAYEQVARWLVRVGKLHVIRRRFRDPRYEPVSMNDAAWARARLSTMVVRRDAPGPFDTALCGLLFATDLHLSVLSDGDTAAVQQVRDWVHDTTPDDVRAVLHALTAAIGSTVITAT